MGIIAGTSAYKIIISTSWTTSEGDEIADGDIVYFFAEDYDKSVANSSKPKLAPLRAFYIPSSIYNVSVTVKNAHVVANQKGTATEEADAIDDFFFQNNMAFGGSPLYLFIYHEADGKYRKLDWDSSKTPINYLACAVDGWNDHAEKGKMITYPSLKFNKAA